MNGVLYIAQPPTRGPLKLGQTTADVITRVRRLSGQALGKYQLLRAFPTAHPVTAERIAFNWLAQRNVQRVGGPKDEHLNANIELLEEACLAGIDGAVALTKLEPQAPRLPAAHPSSTWIFPKTRIWQVLAQMPLKLNGIDSTLGALLAQAATCPRAQSRVRKFGFELVAFKPKEVQFMVEWNSSEKLKLWLFAHAAFPQKPPTHLVLKRAFA